MRLTTAIASTMIGFTVVACGPVHHHHHTPTATPVISQSASPSGTITSSPSPTVSYTWPPTTACGVQRWPVKTGSDPGAGKVDLTVVTQTTIGWLDSIPAPPESSLGQSTRLAPVEDTLYRVTGTLVEAKQEPDSDYHLVLSDGQGHTMIAEIPDPACVSKSSPFLPGIESARAEFNARYSPGDSWVHIGQTVSVIGVGFFDYDHGQTGVAPNAIEIHPVLDIQFG